MVYVKWLWGLMDKKYHIPHIIALCISVLTSVLLLVNPMMTAKLMDDVIIAQNTEPLVGILLTMLAVKIIREGSRYLMIVLLEKSSQNVIYNLRTRLFSRLQYRDMRFFDHNRAGDLMTRLSSDTDYCRHFLSYIDYQITDSVIMFISTSVYLFFVNWKLALCMVLVTPILMVLTKFYSRRVRRMFMDMRDKLSHMNARAQENITGNRVVKAFAREEYEKEQFDKLSVAFRDANLDINKRWLKFYPLIEILANVMTLITVFFGGYLLILGELTPGELTIFTGLSWALSNPMRNLGNLLNDWHRFTTSAQKVMEIETGKPRIVDSPNAKPLPDLKGAIEFDHVSFSYDRQEVLHDVTFSVKPGETVAIMGPTGSGKTTLIQLMTRFYEVTGGHVRIDNVDVKDWKLEQLRRSIGCAIQDVFLFSDTVEGNIAFGNQSLTFDDVLDYSVRADADEFVHKLPEKYDTIVGERGVGLSGGQRQRLSLARALAMRPGILILDDTTSAVDMETETYIQQQLASLPYSCTRMIIAQRISSVKNADQILILKDGRITERGTHEELLKQRGYYYETFCLQNGIEPEKEAN